MSGSQLQRMVLANGCHRYIVIYRRGEELAAMAAADAWLVNPALNFDGINWLQVLHAVVDLAYSRAVFEGP